jgi:hypothetical protein
MEEIEVHNVNRIDEIYDAEQRKSICNLLYCSCC